MKKAYCDKCGVEINAKNRFNGFKVSVSGVEFKTRFPDAIPIDYDVCNYCVIDAIASLDDRPRRA